MQSRGVFEVGEAGIGKSADKPGSVAQSCDCGAVIPLVHALLHGSSSLPGSSASRINAPLFGLAPDGVYRASPVASPAVSSYLAVSPLPDLLAEPSAVCSLLHFPSPWANRLASLGL